MLCVDRIVFLKGIIFISMADFIEFSQAEYKMVIMSLKKYSSGGLDIFSKVLLAGPPSQKKRRTRRLSFSVRTVCGLGPQLT